MHVFFLYDLNKKCVRQSKKIYKVNRWAPSASEKFHIAKKLPIVLL